jgi:hypothetical protein
MIAELDRVSIITIDAAFRVKPDRTVSILGYVVNGGIVEDVQSGRSPRINPMRME